MAQSKSKEHYFKVLRKHDLSELIAKKGQFNYLSWADAVDILRQLKPDATWRVIKDEQNGWPYIISDAGCFVEVEVTVDGIPLSQIHPILDNRNQTIEKPNAFQVNTSIQRCLAKAIALHGLGIHLFAGEDLPPSPPLDEKQTQTLINTLKDNDKEGLVDTVEHQISIGQINQSNFHKAMEHYTNT